MQRKYNFIVDEPVIENEFLKFLELKTTIDSISPLGGRERSMSYPAPTSKPSSVANLQKRKSRGWEPLAMQKILAEEAELSKIQKMTEEQSKKEEIVAKKEDLKNNRTPPADLKLTIGNLQEDLRQCSEREKILKIEVENLKKELLDCTQKYQLENIGKKVENAELMAKIDSLEKRLSESENHITGHSLANEKEKLEKSQKLVAFLEQIQSLEKSLKENQERENEQKKRMENIEKLLNTKDEEIHQQKTHSTKEKEIHLQECNQIRQQNEILNKEKQQEKENQSKKFVELEEVFKKKDQDFSVKIQEKEKNIEAMKSKVLLLESHNHSLSKSINELQHQYQTLKKLFNETKEAFQSNQKKLPSLFGEVNQILQGAITKQNSNALIAVEKYRKETSKNRKLYNEIQDLKGNIRVYCRVRPLSQEEVNSEEISAIGFPESDVLSIINPISSQSKSFEFEKVFDPNSSQEEVFDEVSDLIKSVMDGYNVCIFAYGQTGSGKTFTMDGPKENPGVNFRAIQELFRLSKEREGEYKTQVSISILEIYNEKIRDLLIEPLKMKGKKYEIKQGESGVYVPDITILPVHTHDDIIKITEFGKRNRATSATNVNEHSSRSHSLVIVKVDSVNLVSGDCWSGKLTLVDLAGSERVDKTGATDQRLKEAQAINKSLSALGNVISALHSKEKHIPYRDSKITYLLQDSLGGTSKSLMFVQVNPSINSASESLCSLLFASRVTCITSKAIKKNGAIVQIQQISEANIQSLKDHIIKLEDVIQSKGEVAPPPPVVQIITLGSIPSKKNKVPSTKKKNKKKKKK